MADSRDILGKNRKFTGTTGVKIPTGTQAQRVDETAQLRFNSDTNLMEYYTGTDWKPIDSPPTITQFTVAGRTAGVTGYIDRTGVSDSTVETIVISGSLFDTTGAVVTFEGTTGGAGTVATQSITRDSSSQLTVTVNSADFLEADDPYTIKVTNGSGLSGILAESLDVNAPPTFTTTADTNIGNVQNGDTATQYDANLTTVQATDPDGDSITYSITTGSLPTGMTLASDGTFEGTASGLTSSVTDFTFTVTAATSKGNASRQFVLSGRDSFYVAATGGTITQSGDYAVHTFLADATFTVTATGDPTGSSTVEYLVVAGGGGGGRGANAGGAGAGAGGLRTNFPSPATGGFSVTATGYPISVGNGGAGSNTSSTPGSGGSTSTFSTITSAGGGAGGGYTNNGGSGGSGGGAGSDGGSPGAGNTPSVSPSQGNAGGNGVTPGGPEYAGGGGGGHGAAGTNGSASGPGAPGGAGTQVNIDGNNYYWAGGGGGPSWDSPPPAGNGGIGGGGGGHTPTGSVGTGGGSAINSGNPGGVTDPGGPGGTNDGDGGANTGGGGGGSTNDATGAAGQGGKGIVIIRYKNQ